MVKVRVFVLDTNRLDRPQLVWFEQALRNSPDDWKIGAFHHPLYSNGLTHGPLLAHRAHVDRMALRRFVRGTSAEALSRVC